MTGGLLILAFLGAMETARRLRARRREADFVRLLGTARALLEPPTLDALAE